MIPTKVIAGLLREYRISEVIGDNFAAAWVESEFRAMGLRYRKSELPKGRLYLEGLPVFTRRMLSLPDHPKLLRELRLLERRTHVGGKDSVDHGRVGSDDYANAVFGALYYAKQPRQRIRCFVGIAPGYPGCPTEIDLETGRPIRPERTHIRFVRLTEQEAPAVRGRVHGKFGS